MITVKKLQEIADILEKERAKMSYHPEIHFVPNPLLTGKLVTITVKGSNEFQVAPELLKDESTFQKAMGVLRVIEVEDFKNQDYPLGTPVEFKRPTLLDYFSYKLYIP